MMRRTNWTARFIGLAGFISIILITPIFAGESLGGSSLAFAQGTVPGSPTDDEVNAIAKQLYCPVCENIPLDVCPTQACAQWRDLIRQKLSDGWSEQQIKDYFVEQYGERVLGAPLARGFNWLVYLVPPLAIIAGIYILYRAFLSMRAKPMDQANTAAVSETPADDYIKRMEEELRKKD
jgi:cytochrome c-type biogenesis protein CcmH